VLRAKSSTVAAELALPNEIGVEVERYIIGFNDWAQASGVPERIGVGVPGVFWRGESGGPLAYDKWRLILTKACHDAGIPRFTSHSLRRAFATYAVTVVSRSLAASAGFWTSTRRMDDHYVQPSGSRIDTLLSHLRDRPAGPHELPSAKEPAYAPTNEAGR
jgi:hypothetical protein